MPLEVRQGEEPSGRMRTIVITRPDGGLDLPRLSARRKGVAAADHNVQPHLSSSDGLRSGQQASPAHSSGDTSCLVDRDRLRD